MGSYDARDCEIPKCYCKISGYDHEADYKTWTPEQVHPYMKLVLESFGASRVMYGSDWPVCLLPANYSMVMALVTDFITDLVKNSKMLLWEEMPLNFTT